MRMPSTPRLVVSVLCASLTVPGCAPNLADVHNPQGVVKLDAHGRAPTAELVLTAIRMGATATHWVITSEAPGVVVAQMSSRGQHASVHIDYNARGWIIRHQASSPGLKYNADHEGRQQIHHRYNVWVRQLNRAIEDALIQLRAPD